MDNRKSLIILASSYPYAFGEPYLEAEINILSKSFDKIYILITDYKVIKSSKTSFFIPENVEIVPFYFNKNIIDKIYSVKYFFSSIFYDELGIVKQHYHSKITWGIIKTLLIALIGGDLMEKRLIKFLSDKKIESGNCFIYTYWCNKFTYSLAKLKIKYPEIVAFTRIHGWDVYFERSIYNYLPLRYFIFKNINAVFTISNHGRNYLLEKIPFLDKEKIIVNHLGVEKIELVKFTRDKNKLRILSIAFFSKTKRIEMIIDSLSIIDNINIEWHHIGEGKDNSGIKKYANRKLSGKKNIKYEFLGNLSKKQVYETLSNINYDFLINTSSSEGIPVSMMEAMSFGIPVIGTDVGGVSEIIKNNYNGFLLPSNPSIEEIVDDIRRIYLMEDEKFFIFRDNAYTTWKEHFNSELNYKQFYQQILSLENVPVYENLNIVKPHRNLLLTFDYELFLGIKSGSVENSIIEPTNQILAVLKQFNVKAIFFVDTIYLSRLQEISNTHPKAMSDFNSMVNQLQGILKDGHYLFHHIHPHWNYAKYNSNTNEWTTNYTPKFALCNLNDDEKNKVFEQSYQLFEKYVFNPINREYNVEGYRAGGLYIQPFSGIKSMFEKFNIKYDFSVLRGFSSVQTDFFYDFSDIPLKNIYKFSDSVSIENDIGSFTEFTINDVKVDTLTKIGNSFWVRILSRFFIKNKYGDGIPTRAYLVSNSDIGKHVHNKETLSIELLNITKILMYFRFMKNNDYMHFISHPKFISKHNIWALKQFLAKSFSNYEINSDFKKML